MTYKVKLEIFEGPLDLLLYLIKKEELDIYDIPIAKVTNQYLQYLELMKMLDLNIAGEFLVMAATLMHIKSKMLLPPDETPLEEEEEEDPRAELVRRLLEYKRFKETATQLKSMETRQRDVFPRTGGPELIEQQQEGESYFEASLFDLISAFSDAMKDVPKEVFLEIVKEEVTVEEKVHDILHLMVERQEISLAELFAGAKSKMEIVAVFLAILELTRMKAIMAIQRQVFGPIQIIRNNDTEVDR